MVLLQSVKSHRVLIHLLTRDAVNLPIGALTLIIIALILKPTPAGKRGTPLKLQFLQLDPLGTVVLVASLVCLLLALQWGGSTYSWSSGRVIALLVVFVVLFGAFVLVQILLPKTATIQGRVIANRNILAAQLYMFCHGSALMVLVIYVPLWFQGIKGATPVQSGVDTFPMILALVIGIIAGGVLTGKVGYYTPFAYVCAVLAPIGAGLISTWQPHTNHSMWIGYQVIAGLGFGLGFQSAIMAAQTVLPHKDVPMGVSLVQFAQTLGGTVFISVGQNLLSSHLVSGLTPLVPGIGSQTISSLGATELRGLVGPEKLGEVLNVYNNALRSCFHLATGLAAATVLGAAALQWKSVKPAEPKPIETVIGEEKV
jgi:hypothetical protein